MWSGIVVGIIFLILKGIVTCCETSVVELNDSKIRKKAEKSRSAARLLKLLEKPSRLLVSISTFKTISAVIVALVTTLTFYNRLVKAFEFIGNKTVVYFICVLILILSDTLLLVVFGESIPKKFARAHSESFAYKTSGFLRFVVFIMAPLSKLISGISSVFLKVFGLSDSSSEGTVTEEEILMMVDAGNETGTIEKSQKEMINNIFEFDDLVVSDVMTHRTEMVAVDKNISIQKLVDMAVEEGFSRIPVYDNSIDNIVGVVFAKDLLKLVGKNELENLNASTFMRDIMYVPETNHCGKLFAEFTSRKAQIAVVVDEYGGTAGIVTMEDLLESIVGSIQDEYDDETEEIIQISENEYEIDGTADPEVVMEKLRLELPEEHDYDTISGFVIDLLGHIPTKNEHPKADYKNVTFTVLQTEENRITKLRVKVNYEPEDIN